jgi:addiction module RelE/StbE family toxin
MRNLIWRPSARQAYLEIVEYVAQRNPLAAIRLQQDIERKTSTLRSFSDIGRPGRVANTRELVVHPNYLIVYRVGSRSVTILRILHARQLYP